MHVVRSITGELGRPVSGFPAGLRRYKGVSTTDIPVLLSGIHGSNVVGRRRGVVLSNFKTKLA